MKLSQPFARALACMEAFAAAMALPIDMQRLALSKLEPYRSRGKGKGRPSYAHGHNRNSHNAVPFHANGAGPIARRQRQAENARGSTLRHKNMLSGLRSNANKRA